MIQPSRILVLAPHTDDGELGCGGSIARFCREKREVHYVAFSTCKKSLPTGFAPDTLEKECKAAVKELGMDPGKLLFFDFDVREFTNKRQEILEELVSLNKSIQPDLVFIPSAFDIHQDHQVIHNEALRAFNKSSLLGYELPWNQTKFSTQLFLKVSASDMDRKVNALKAYASQAHRNYMHEEHTRSLGRVRGVQCNQQYAEAFEIFKLIS
jgi:LmbE family N-acetylglucosaminyl deacetylase